jgi:hypothetical protein
MFACNTLKLPFGSFTRYAAVALAMTSPAMGDRRKETANVDGAASHSCM